MTGAAMLGLVVQLRALAQEVLGRVQALKGLLRAPWWATMFPPAMWYVFMKSAALETRLYLAREELERRAASALGDLADAERQAQALGDQVGNPGDLLRLQAQLTADAGDAVRLEALAGQAQAQSDDTLRRVPEAGSEAAELPLKVLGAAGWLAKWGPWLGALLVAAFLVYAWRVGGVKQAVADVKEQVTP